MSNTTQTQEHTSFGSNWSLATIKDLKPGLRYIQVMNNLTPSEVKKTEFHIHEIRRQIRYNNGKFELLHEYTAYKDFIKKSVKNGEIYIYKPKSSKTKGAAKEVVDLFNN